MVNEAVIAEARYRESASRNPASRGDGRKDGSQRPSVVYGVKANADQQAAAGEPTQDESISAVGQPPGAQRLPRSSAELGPRYESEGGVRKVAA